MRDTLPHSRLSFPERLNFLVTNRLPRHWLTLAVGRLSRVENRFVAALLIGTWRLFVDDLRLWEAKKQRFDSLLDCFVRELKEGARPVDDDPEVLASPVDAVVGEFGDVDGLSVVQAKGFPYTLPELFGSEARAAPYHDGRFVTLRLKSSMYHRFHAPCAGRVGDVLYISGDTWNVNPVALKTVERLFCRNERAVIGLASEAHGSTVTLVAVAAILVASMHIHGLAEPLDLRYRGPNLLPCNRSVGKGVELGYFAHGSTIVLFTTADFEFVPGLATGETIRMGRPLMRKRTDAPL